MKKTFAILLAALLLLGSLAGCAGTGVQDNVVTPSPEPTPEATADPSAAAAHNWDGAYAAYTPDTVVMTVNGSDVTWGEFFYWLYYNISSMENYLGPVSDFSEVFPYGDGTQTYAQYFLSAAKDYVVQYHVLEKNATEAGAAVTDADKEELSALLQSDIVSACGEGATEQDFYDYLASVYVSPEVYNYINTVSVLYTNGFDVLYGADGAALADADAQAFAEANGYMTAKHILIKTTDDEGAALDETAKAEKLAKAQDLLAQLRAEQDEAKRLALFDTLMNENSQDPGLAAYPAGYCFPTGQMYEAFETATAALGDNEISDVVETDAGYHIILRLPMSLDDVVQYYSADEQYTLRYMAALDAYDVLVGNWIADADVVWAEGFEDLDLNALTA